MMRQPQQLLCPPLLLVWGLLVAAAAASSLTAAQATPSICDGGLSFPDMSLVTGGMVYTYNPCTAVTSSVCLHPGAVQFCQQYSPPLSYSWTAAYFASGNPSTTWSLSAQGALTSAVANGDSCAQLNPSVPRSVVVTYVCDPTVSVSASQLVSVVDAVTLSAATSTTCHFAIQVVTRAACTQAPSICPSLPSSFTPDLALTDTNGMVYTYNPCTYVTSAVCLHPGAVQFCQQYSPPLSYSWTPAYYTPGNTAIFYYTSAQGLLASYEANGDTCTQVSPSVPRSVQVTYVCDPSVRGLRLQSVADAATQTQATNQTCRFTLVVATSAVCSTSSSSSSPALSLSSSSSTAVAASASSSTAIRPVVSICNLTGGLSFPDMSLVTGGMVYTYNPCTAVTSSVCLHPGAVQFCQQYSPPLSYSWTAAYFASGNPSTTWSLSAQGALTSAVANGDSCAQLNPSVPRSVVVTYVCDPTVSVSASQLVSVVDAVTLSAATSTTCHFAIQVVTRAACTQAPSICPSLPSSFTPDLALTDTNGMVYTYNPCTYVTSAVCLHPGAVQFCQQYSPPLSYSWTPAYYTPGNTAIFYYTSAQGLLASYEANGDTCTQVSPSVPRSVQVTYVCDPSVRGLRLQSVADAATQTQATNQTCRFTLVVATSAVCSTSSSSSSPALSLSSSSSTAVAASASSSTAIRPVVSICNLTGGLSFPDMSLVTGGMVYTYNPCTAVTSSVCLHPGAVQFCQQYSPPLSYSWTAAYFASGNPSTTWSLSAQGALTSAVANGDSCAQLNPSVPRSVVVTYVCDPTVSVSASQLVSVVDAVTLSAATSTTCHFAIQVVTRAACTQAPSICPSLPSSFTPDLALTDTNGMVYTYNPCTYVTSAVCLHPGAVQFCQQYSPPLSYSWTPAYYTPGNTAIFYYTSAQGLLASYEANGDTCTQVSPSVPRSVQVTYVCDPSVRGLRLQSVADAATQTQATNQTCRFTLVVATSAVCSTSSSSSSPALSLSSSSSTAVAASASSSTAIRPVVSICNLTGGLSFPDMSLVTGGMVYTYNPCTAVTSSVCLHPGAVQFCQQYSPPLSYSWTAAYFASGNPSTTWSLSAQGALTSAVANGDSCAQLNPSVPRSVVVTYVCDPTVSVSASQLVSVVDAVTLSAATSTTCHFAIQVVTRAACTQAPSICPSLPSSFTPDLALTDTNGMVYTYNPCTYVTSAVCLHPGAVQFCQQYSPPLSYSWTPAYYTPGNTAIFYYTSAQGLLASYEANGDTCTQVSPSVPRSVQVTYVCDPSVRGLRLQSVADAATQTQATNQTCRFTLVVATSAVCSTSSSSSSPALSLSSSSSTAVAASASSSTAIRPVVSICNLTGGLSFPDMSLVTGGMVYTYNPCTAVTSSVCLHPGAVQFCQQYSPPLSYSWTAAYFASGNPSTTWSLSAQGALTSAVANGDSCAQLNPSVPRSVVVTYVCDPTVSVSASQLVSVVDAVTLSAATSTTCHFAIQVVTRAACTQAPSICPSLPSSFTPDLALTDTNGMVYTYNPCTYVTSAVCLHPGAVQFCQQYSPPLSYSWTPAYYTPGNTAIFYYTSAQGLLASYEANGDTCTQVSPSVPRSVQVTYVCDPSVRGLRLQSVADAATQTQATNQTCRFTLVVATSAVCSTSSSSSSPALSLSSSSSTAVAASASSSTAIRPVVSICNLTGGLSFPDMSLVTGGMVYTYNPCTAVTSSVCLHPGAVQFCQQYSPPLSYSWTAAYFASGNPSTTWSLSAQGALTSAVANGDSCAQLNPSVPRSVVVTYVCDPTVSVSASQLVSVVDAVTLSAATSTTCHFAIQVVTRAACTQAPSICPSLPSSFTPDLALTDTNGMVYTYNPCTYVTSAVCLHPGAVQFCQQYSPPLSYSWTPAYYTPGNTAIFYYTSAQGLLASYEANGDTCTQVSPSVPRSVQVTYVCDPSVRGLRLQSVADAATQTQATNQTCRFTLVVHTVTVCHGVSSSSSSTALIPPRLVCADCPSFSSSTGTASSGYPAGSERVSFFLTISATFTAPPAELVSQLQLDIAVNLATLMGDAHYEPLLPFIIIESINGTAVELPSVSSSRRLLQSDDGSSQLPVVFVLSNQMSSVTSMSASSAVDAFSAAASNGQLNTTIPGATIPPQNVSMASASSPAPTASSSSAALSGGAVAGIVAGVIGGLGVCALLLYALLTAMRRKESAAQRTVSKGGMDGVIAVSPRSAAVAVCPAHRVAEMLEMAAPPPAYSVEPPAENERSEGQPAIEYAQ